MTKGNGMAKEEVRKFREVVRDLHGIGKEILGERGYAEADRSLLHAKYVVAPQ